MYFALKETIFVKTAGTCLSKCSVHINNLNYWTRYSLRQVYVTIGTDETFTETICPQLHTRDVPMYMYIECLLWNEG